MGHWGLSDWFVSTGLVKKGKKGKAKVWSNTATWRWRFWQYIVKHSLLVICFTITHKQIYHPLTKNIDKYAAKLGFVTLKLPSIKNLLFSSIFENITKFPSIVAMDSNQLLPFFVISLVLNIRRSSQQLCHKLTKYDSKNALLIS